MYIKITSVVSGSPCEATFRGVGQNEIDMEWAEENGLFKYRGCLHSLEVGDCINVCCETSDRLPEIANGNFTYEVIQSKYMNHSVGSDTKAYEVIEWLTPKKAMVRKLKPVFEAGEYPHESTDKFEQDPDEQVIMVRMHKNGLFYETGSKCCPFFPTETPHYYYDLSF